MSGGMTELESSKSSEEIIKTPKKIKLSKRGKEKPDTEKKLTLETPRKEKSSFPPPQPPKRSDSKGKGKDKKILEIDFDIPMHPTSEHIDKDTIKTVIIESKLAHEDSTEQAKNILNAFNLKRGEQPSAFTKRWFMGREVGPDQFLLGARNKVPELTLFSKSQKIDRVYSPFNPALKTEILTQVEQTNRFFGAYGSYVLNVPQNHYCKAWSGTVPKLYGPGPHVIHDVNFRFDRDSKNDTVDRAEPYIHHNTIHIVRIPKRAVMKVWIGQEPLLLESRVEPYVFNTPLFQIEKYNKNDLFWDATSQYIVHGSIHILRIPAGFLAKIWLGTKPLLLDSRTEPYVFNDMLFTLDKPNDNDLFWDATAQYINHGTIHILRIPAGFVAKVWTGSEPLILESQKEPYVFDSLMFKVDRPNKRDLFWDATANYIHHGTLNILRIPAGYLAKVWKGSEPLLLESQIEPYVFDSAMFKIDPYSDDQPYWDTTAPYIHHGTIHILRIPAGFIAKVWKGSEPLLLEAQDKPYVFNSPSFRVEGNNKTMFCDATDELIIHGSLKRVIPMTGRVAITYDCGNLKIIEPSSNGTPALINSQTHKVHGFLDTNVQTYLFPSDEMKNLKKNENPHATSEEISYFIYTTRDSLKIGVKLLVAYQTIDPYKVLSRLRKEGIQSHVENLAAVDMGKTIQQLSSQEFLNFYINKPANKKEGEVLDLSIPQMNFQDIVKVALSKDLLEYGIELIRFNVETPVVLDKEIAKQMEESSLLSAKANAQESVIEQQMRISAAQADQKARAKQIEQNQINEAKLSQQKTDAEGARLAAEVVMIKAKSESDAMLLKAKSESDAMLLKAKAESDAMLMKAKVYENYPSLFELKKIEYITDAIKQANFLTPVATPGIEQLFNTASYNTPLTFLNNKHDAVKPTPTKGNS